MAVDNHFGVVLAILVISCVVGGLALGVQECPMFKEDGDDVMIKLCEDTCYYFHLQEVETFGDASAICDGRGGSLVMPKTKDISDFLIEELQSYGKKEKVQGTSEYRIWLGMWQGSNPNNRAHFWLNGEEVDSKYAEKVLEYGEALSIERNEGVWDFTHSNKAAKNHFVCEIKADDVFKNATKTKGGDDDDEVVDTTTTTIKDPATTNPTPVTMVTPSPPNINYLFCPKINNNNNNDDGDHMKFFGETCFYFQLKTITTYEVAEKFCKDRQGSLAKVENEVVETFLQYHLEHSFKMPNYTVWIGLQRKMTSSPSPYYVWEDGSPATYTNFRYKTPFHARFAMSGVDKKWETYPKGFRKHFVCQFKSNYHRQK